MPITAVLVSGIVLVVLGGLLALLVNPKSANYIQACGTCALLVAGFYSFVATRSVGARFTSNLHPQVGLDPLSGFFLALLGIVAMPVLVFSTGYFDSSTRSRLLAWLSSLFLLAMVLLLCARDPTLLLGGWEMMTLIPAVMILVAHPREPKASRAVWIYLGVTHIGGAGTWVAILVLAGHHALGGPSSLHLAYGIQVLVCVSAIIGLGTKAGLMPFHVWLPRAHPIAPAPVSALMSGVMIKVSIYLLVRILIDWLGPVPMWIGIIVLALGALSAVGGVTYAIFQHELKRLLAMHSIENIGIITLALGASLCFRAQHELVWASIALGAALFHSLNHAIFKSLLFLGSGTFEKYLGALNIDRMGGLLRKLPIIGVSFLVGSMAIAGLPPLNGFASEWLTLQSLIHVSQFGKMGESLAGALALVALAVTAALAVLCFIKVIGLVLLGSQRSTPYSKAMEPTRPMNIALAFLALCCLVIGVVPGLVFGYLIHLSPWQGSHRLSTGLYLPGGDSLPTLWVTGGLLCLVGIFYLARGTKTASESPTWACGQDLSPRLLWTSSGFSKPLKMTLQTLLRPSRSINTSELGNVVQKVTYQSSVPHHFESHLYAPLHRFMLTQAVRVRKLQSGKLSVYVSYLIGLVIVALSLIRLGVIR